MTLPTELHSQGLAHSFCIFYAIRLHCLTDKSTIRSRIPSPTRPGSILLVLFSVLYADIASSTNWWFEIRSHVFIYPALLKIFRSTLLVLYSLSYAGIASPTIQRFEDGSHDFTYPVSLTMNGPSFWYCFRRRTLTLPPWQIDNSMHVSWLCVRSFSHKALLNSFVLFSVS